MKKEMGLVIWILIFSWHYSCAQPDSRAIVNYSNAQQFMNDGNGRPLFLHSDYTIEGSPFFSEAYCTAAMKVRNGKKYVGIRVKVNLQENLVIYELPDGKEMAATSPIEKIEFFNCNDPLKNRTLVSGFPPVDEQTGNSFYVLLDSGNIILLKYIKINYRDTKSYGSANTTRVFEQKDIFYAYVPGKGMNRISKDTDAVLSLFNDKKTEVSNFMTKNYLKCRREEDLAKIFAYYNSLN